MFVCLLCLCWVEAQSSKSRAERKKTATSFRNPLPATNSCLKAWSRNQEILKILFLDPIITMCSDVIMDNKVGLKSSIHLYLKAKLHNLYESLKQSFDLSEFKYKILGRSGFFCFFWNSTTPITLQPSYGEGKGAAKNEAHSSMKYTQIQQLSKNEEGFVGMLHLMQQPTVNHVENYICTLYIP